MPTLKKKKSQSSTLAIHLVEHTYGISPKSEPSLKSLKAGTHAKTSSDAHTAQSVQPQGLASQRKADKKTEKVPFQMDLVFRHQL